MRTTDKPDSPSDREAHDKILAETQRAAEDAPKCRQDVWSLRMQIVVSLALSGAALYVILSKQYQSVDTNWAYGIVGTVVGY